jgi:hypothetical protein
MELEESIKESDLDIASLTNWTDEVLAWELDHSELNLFESKITGNFWPSFKLFIVSSEVQPQHRQLFI